MRKRFPFAIGHLAFLVVVMLGVSAAVRADEDPVAAPGTPEFRAQVTAWVEDLRSEKFDVREHARKALEQWGGEAPDLLEGLRDDADAEVRRTVRGILDRHGRPPVVTPLPTAGLSTLALVTLHAEKQPLQAVLDDLGRAHAARITVEASRREHPIDVSLEGVPFFEALGRIAGAAGLGALDPFSDGGDLELKPIDPDAEAAPCASAGPIRLRVLSVTATRSLATRAAKKYVVGLQLDWAPEVQLVTYRSPVVKAARDPDGVEYSGPRGLESQTVYGVGGTRRSAEVSVPLEPTSSDAKERLATLDLKLLLRLRHDRREVRFADVSRLPASFDEDGTPGEAGKPGVVTLHSLAQPEGQPGTWVADLSATLALEVSQQSAQASVETEDGRLHPLWIAGGRSIASADGLLRLTGRAFGLGTSVPKALRFAWFLREEEGEVSVSLTDVPLR